MKMEEVTFRFATEADYDAVVNVIPDAGALPDIYPSLMADPTFYGVVGEASGSVVAFGGAYITCAGTKLFSFGGRVHENWRKFGVYKKLKEFLRTQLREGPFPNLTVEEFVTHGDNASLDAIFNSQTYRHMFTRDVKILDKVSDVLGCSLVGDETQRPDIRVEDIGLVGLEKVLSEPDLRQRIFPDRVEVGIRMFDPAVSEINAIAALSPRILASFSAQDDIRMISTSGTYGSIGYVLHFHFNTGITAGVAAQHFALHLGEHMRANATPLPKWGIAVPKGYMDEILQRVKLTGLAENNTFFNSPASHAFYRDI